MEDKEVGVIWRKLNSDCNKGTQCDNHGDLFGLIRKLVEEEAFRRWRRGGRDKNEAWLSVLSDYGIDQESYNGSK